MPSASSLSIIFSLIFPPFFAKFPNCKFMLSPYPPVLFVFLLLPKGACQRLNQSILSLFNRERQLNKAVLLICTCDLQLACFLINFLFVRAFVRYFVFIASGVINSNTVFYAKFWVKITPVIYLNKHCPVWKLEAMLCVMEEGEEWQLYILLT